MQNSHLDLHLSKRSLKNEDNCIKYKPYPQLCLYLSNFSCHPSTANQKFLHPARHLFKAKAKANQPNQTTFTFLPYLSKVKPPWTKWLHFTTLTLISFKTQHSLTTTTTTTSHIKASPSLLLLLLTLSQTLLLLKLQSLLLFLPLRGKSPRA